MMSHMQQLVFGSKLRAISIHPTPLFIIGHWRTGTTYLHELLSQDDRFVFPTTFECLAPHHCLLTQAWFAKAFGWMMPPARLVDNVTMGFDRPQEDEFALMSTGAPSPMWSFAYPDDTLGDEYLTLGALSSEDRNRWGQLLVHFLQLVTFRQGRKPIILKSPGHTARIEVLLKLFPQARFLHIVRDPYTVFASTMHLWKTTVGVSRMIDNDSENLQGRVLHNFSAMYQGFADARGKIPSGQFCQVRYEDLVADPLTVLKSSYQSLQLGDFENVRHRVTQYANALKRYKTNSFDINADMRRLVDQHWASIFREWGY